MTPQERARDDIMRIIEDAIDRAGERGPLDTDHPRTRVLKRVAIAQEATDRILKLELLITGGKARPVIETDWRDSDDEYETWTVYTQPNEEDE